MRIRAVAKSRCYPKVVADQGSELYATHNVEHRKPAGREPGLVVAQASLRIFAHKLPRRIHNPDLIVCLALFLPPATNQTNHAAFATEILQLGECRSHFLLPKFRVIAAQESFGKQNPARAVLLGLVKHSPSFD